LNIVTAIIRFSIGAAFGGLCGFALAPAIAAFITDPAVSEAMLYVTMSLGGIVCLLALTIRIAVGRGLVILGACVAALPISVTF